LSASRFAFTTMEPRSVGIVGVGLIGGSIALAALRAGYRVYLYDCLAPEKLAGGKFRSAMIVENLEELASHGRLIILATPIAALTKIAAVLGELVSSGHLVSDVAGVKEPVTKSLANAFRNRCEYVPAHPMAGSEKSGAEASRADLFDGAVTLVCPEFASDAASVQLVKGFWEELGTRVVLANVAAHDQLVAAMSHLPHLLAALLVRHVAATNSAALALCGPGFRDSTRIASGAPELWTDILLSNSDAVKQHLLAFKELLEEALILLTEKDAKKLQALLDDAKQNRDRLSP
jgi:prephenate dehydrogenase